MTQPRNSVSSVRVRPLASCLPLTLQERISILARNLEYAREDEETTAIEIRVMERNFLKLVAERDRRAKKVARVVPASTEEGR